MKTSLSSIATLFFIIAPAVIQGQAYSELCHDAACVDLLPMSCEGVLLEYDLQDGDDCCMSLTDNEFGGCTLTVGAGANTDTASTFSSCHKEGRHFPCTADTDNFPEFSCLGNSLASYDINTTEGCPASQYEFPMDSVSGFLPGLTMTLEGVAASSWTDEDTDEWIALTENHTSTFFESNPDLGMTDVLNYINAYNGNTVVLENEVTLYYMQVVSWRTELPNLNGTTLFEEAFVSEAGKQAYLALLQGSNSTALGSITDYKNDDADLRNTTEAPTLSDEGEFALPTGDEPEDSTPGGAGSSVTTQHETETEPPIPASKNGTAETDAASDGDAQGQELSSATDASGAPSGFAGTMALVAGMFAFLFGW